ncbi:helix-turn-helix transcriptional regulator [Actinocorallia aurea]
MVDVQAILSAYGGTDQALRLAILKLAEEIRAGLRGWWAPFGDVLNGSYAECENVAEEILSYQPAYVPGLFQTPEYARAIMRADGYSGELLERRVQTRMTRQVLLAREEPPRMRVLLEETALRLDIGDRAAMEKQLEALLAIAKRPHIELRVIEQVGHVRIHPGRHGGTSVIFGFGGPVELGVVYLETIAGGHYLEEVTQVQRCRLLFGRMADTALSEDDSAALIADLIKEPGQ